MNQKREKKDGDSSGNKVTPAPTAGLAVTGVTGSTEDQIQAEFWRWAWNTYPQAQRHMWAVPNGAIGRIITLKDAVQASKMKATGLLEGVWDLHMFWHGQFHIIETKVPGGRLTVDHVDSKNRKHYGQQEWGEMMAAHGAQRHIYHSLAEGQEIFKAIING